MRYRLPVALFSVATLFFFSCNSDSAPAESVAVAEQSEAAAPPAGIPASQKTLAPAGPIDNNYLLGKFDPATRTDFVVMGKPYADRSGMMLRKEAAEAFKKMWEAARKEKISLKIISSTRTFAQQKTSLSSL